jgi:hypothetical protein
MQDYETGVNSFEKGSRICKAYSGVRVEFSRMCFS